MYSLASAFSCQGTVVMVKSITLIINVLFTLFQVVQEYERAVIFRLGRLAKGGAKGPGECQSFS